VELEQAQSIGHWKTEKQDEQGYQQAPELAVIDSLGFQQ
jgi:hypothetical protein